MSNSDPKTVYLAFDALDLVTCITGIQLALGNVTDRTSEAAITQIEKTLGKLEDAVEVFKE